ncbi:MAG: flavodoxin [Eubacterium sp.]|nr:flavodoxin [Eubacterium sp.]
MTEKKFLVVYFSWSGNAKKAAVRTAKKLNADIFEIVPEEAYSKVYDECLKRVIREVEEGLLPAYKNDVPNFDDYTDIVFGYPAWAYTCPKIVLSFINKHDFKGKKVHLFNTHLGSGSVGTDDIKNACSGAVSVDKSIDASKLTDRDIEKWQNS